MKPTLTTITREKVVVEKRKPLTKAQAIFLASRQRGVCGCGCGVDLDSLVERVIDEHVDRLDMGGTNAMPNRALYRLPCAKAKTAAEAPKAAKVKRLAGETCTERRGPPMKSRPMGKSRGFEKGPTQRLQSRPFQKRWNQER